MRRAAGEVQALRCAPVLFLLLNHVVYIYIYRVGDATETSAACVL